MNVDMLESLDCHWSQFRFAMVDVAGFYSSVINDVIEGMKETFTQEGLDLDLLEQLRKVLLILSLTELSTSAISCGPPNWLKLTWPTQSPLFRPRFTTRSVCKLRNFRQQTCVGQQGMPIPISRLPIQPNSLAGVSGGGGGGMRTLAPIARPNAPLTMSAATPTTGLVLRSAVGTSVQAPGTTAGRPPIVLAAALNPQAAGVQPRLANSLAGIAIRTPLGASGPGQPGTATTATIIGQPTMTSVNGVPTIPGQNVQILQVGQQTFVVPVQFRQPLGSAAATTQQLHDATGATIIAAAAPQQTQQQSFNRTQVDGVDDSDFDDDDDDVEVVEPYSVDTPSLRASMSVTTPQSLFSRTPGSAVQLLMGGSSTGVGGGGGGGGSGGTGVTATPGGGDGEDDSDDDDADMVVATPGVAGSMLTPNPASVATAASTTPATPHTMPTSTTTSASATTTASAAANTSKRAYDTVTTGAVAGGGGVGGGGGDLSRPRVAKRPRSSAHGDGKEFREYDDDLDDDLADDEEEDDEEDEEVEEEEEEEEEEGEFGSVATMTPAGQHWRCWRQRQQRRQRRRRWADVWRPDGSRRCRHQWLVLEGRTTGGGGEDDHIPDLPPSPPSSPQTPFNNGDAKGSGGTGDMEGTEGKGTGLAAEEEGEEEQLNSGDDVTDEELDSLFESDNLVVCQYEKVSHSRSKWRFWMRDGIMKIRGRDHLFQKLFAEVDWLIVPTNSVPAL
uniref:Tfiia large subunit n=1 Tax=Echinococcus granulosus TaxID=6210 RepID=A0A068WTY6_ECHGR|nr:tfiia large subunit [Echinococcus granulosus]